MWIPWIGGASLAPCMSKSDLYYRDGFHPADSGSKVLARLLLAHMGMSVPSTGLIAL